MENEFIICAAIYYDDGVSRGNLPRNIETGIVAAGWRHHNCYTLLGTIYPDFSYKKTDVQGFLTSKGRFVDRKEAAKIALESKQISYLNFHPEELFSEDIY